MTRLDIGSQASAFVAGREHHNAKDDHGDDYFSSRDFARRSALSAEPASRMYLQRL
jgi:hypothetical protein